MPVRSRSAKPPKVSVRAVSSVRRSAARSAVLDPIITMNGGGVIQSASDSVEQVFGWTPTELFGRNLKMLIPEPRRSALDRYLDRYRNAGTTKTLTRKRRFDALRKDGSVFEIELSMSRADLPAHSAPFFIGIVRDVTQEIDVDADPRGEQTRLQRLITEQTRALATANLRLQLADRLASLGTLAAGLGHDMNSVLLPVRARLDALEHSGVTPAARDHIVAVRRSVAYLQHLSDGLHFLSLNPDAPDSTDERLGATTLTQWWNQVGTLLKMMVPRHVALSAEFPKGLPSVAIAPHWLTQIMLNLIVNAGEAIPTSNRRARVRIFAAAGETDRSVRVSVTDNGRGMTPAVCRRAFDLFFTTKPRSMGTGLGLPLARNVALRAGGELEISSSPGKGTTVVLVLPAVAPGAQRASDPTAPGRSAAVSVRDQRAAALISHILLKAGLDIKSPVNHGPGSSDVWVTEPTAKALSVALPWRKRNPRHTLVLLGAPPKRFQNRWATIGATIIDEPEDFGAIRHALGQALLAV